MALKYPLLYTATNSVNYYIAFGFVYWEFGILKKT